MPERDISVGGQHANEENAGGSGPTLQRALGLPSAASIVVGTVIGSGVFLVPSAMIRNVGSVRELFVVWIVAGLLSLFGALTYAELAAAMPEAGGEYVYLTKAYGPFWGYLYGWTQFWVAKSGSIATLAAGFYTYLSAFIPAFSKPVLITPFHIGPGWTLLEIRYGQLFAIAMILVLGVVNYFGVRSGGNLQVFATVLKMVLIAGVILIGLGSGKGDWTHFFQSAPSVGGITGFFAAMVSALWAYDGWNNVSMVSSEIRDPQRNLPRSLIGGTVVVIATYLLVNTAYFYILGPVEVSESRRVAADMMARIYGTGAAGAVTVAVLLSIFAALNGSILSGARVPYAMARDGLFFRFQARVHPQFRTPGNAVVSLCVWSCVVLLSGWYDDLYNYVIFGSWILYLLTAISVFVLRRKRASLLRPYKVIGYPLVPVLFVAMAALLLLNTVLARPRESLMGLFVMAVSVPFYWHWRKGSPSKL
ncbi:MAG: APC family permease [Bryobacteraceae bacterium]